MTFGRVYEMLLPNVNKLAADGEGDGEREKRALNDTWRRPVAPFPTPPVSFRTPRHCNTAAACSRSRQHKQMALALFCFPTFFPLSFRIFTSHQTHPPNAPCAVHRCTYAHGGERIMGLGAILAT